MRVTVSAIVMLGLVSTAAFAQEKKTEAKDPNRMVCEKQQVVGSRLASKRVCMTAAEWAAKRLEERQAIDKSQIQRATQPSN